MNNDIDKDLHDDNDLEYDRYELELFQTEHQRLLRALYLSIDHENELHSQIRRLKESLVAISLRFHLSVKVIAEDEKTISLLRQEALEGKKEAMIAKKQATEAMDVIQSLRYEIHTLKKLLNENQLKSSSSNDRSSVRRVSISPSKNQLGSASPTITTNQVSLGVLADREVDEMFNKLEGQSNERSNHATSFQIWKIKNFIYTSDTPSASEFHDDQAVKQLAQAKAIELADQTIGELPSHRLTKSSLSRTRPSISRPQTMSSNSLLDNDFELPNISMNSIRNNLPASPIGRHNHQHMKEQVTTSKLVNKHFGGVDRVGMWGSDNKLIDDKAKVNIWNPKYQSPIKR
uniref:Uncharacterized protein n=1 Tax=Chromulina nebulosa TaxID=96789 RepID=A0A7S0XDC1_9STRA|mmetsp:Transcript_3227/g.2876  ORF Transcript_3227/g.2876 Transcript_3227/m.2876 type:complete len:346 (+) Transcript_3227:1-1038(+)